jgi:hypothetical protein
MIGTYRATGVAAVAITLDPDKAFSLIELRVHLSAAGGAGNLTVTLDANAGAAYDTLLYTKDMTAVTDLILPDSNLLLPRYFDKGDKIVVAWANGNARTYGIEVKYSS